MIQFHFKDEIFYVLKMNSLNIVTINNIDALSPILISMLKNKDKYNKLSTENKKCIFEISRLLLCYSYVMIICLLVRLRIYIDDKLSVNGFFCMIKM